MIRINLLPHREQKRQARQRQFVSVAVGLAILSLAVVGLVHVIFVTQIENQQSRNNLLKGEIAKLDEQIKEIDKLREQTQALLARKQIVETLQANRTEAVHALDQLVRQLPDGLYLRSVKQVVETLQTNRTEAVHLLDQMVRQLPDGVYLRNLRQVGAKVTAVGYAQSNARVSTLMRNIEASPWLTQPELVEIKSVPLPGAKDKDARVNEFTLTFQLKRAAPPADIKPLSAPAEGGAAPPSAPAKKGAV